MTDDAGNPLGGALIEVWEADADGRYDVQYADGRVAARAHLRTEPDGSYRFWAVTPTPYPIPHDGPVGDLLKAVGRSPMRTSHLHFMVSHPGCRTLVTHIFVRGDEQLEIGEISCPHQRGQIVGETIMHDPLVALTPHLCRLHPFRPMRGAVLFIEKLTFNTVWIALHCERAVF